MNVKELTSKIGPKILIFGRFGTGKTAFAGTGGKLVQFLSLDTNWTVLDSLKDEWREDRIAVDIVPCADSSPQIADAFSKAKAHVLSVVEAIKNGKYPFRVLVLDSLTTLGDAAIRQTKMGSGVLDKVGTPQSPAMTMPMWGIAINEVQNFIILLKSLPIAVVVLAHSELVEVEGTMREQLAIFGKALPGILPGYFSEVLYSTVQVDKDGRPRFVLLTTPSPSRATRSGACLSSPWEMKNGLRALLATCGYEVGNGRD
jgi:hypothetical protein